MRGLAVAGLLAAAVWLLAGNWATGQQSAPSPALLELRQRLPAILGPSQAASVEIELYNRGGAAAEKVVVTASIPNSWELLDADPIPLPGTGATSWQLGTIEANGSRLLRLRLTPAAAERAPDQLRSDVHVTYQAKATAQAIVAVQRPSLALRVSGPEMTMPGEAVSLTIAVTNNGVAPADAVTLQTLLPPGLSHPSGNDLETQIGTVRPGETRQVTLTVTPTQAGEFRTRIRASVAGSPVGEGEAIVSAPAFKLALEANGPRLLYLEWTGTFEVFLRNDDTRPVQQVRVSVALPAGLAVARAGDDGVYDVKSHVLSWHLGDLMPGETRTLVWSGVARAVGDQVCQVHVAAGSHGRKALNWRTTVADTDRSRQPAAGGRQRAVAPAVLHYAPEEPAARQAPADRR